MNRQIRRVGVVVLALFGLLFVNLNLVQVVQATALAEHPRNTIRQLEQEYGIRRGSIVLGNEQREIATVEETPDELRFHRIYPEGPRYAHVTGFLSFIYGRTELERAYNDVLTGSADLIGSWSDLLAGEEPRGDTLVTTIDANVQNAAAEALGGRRGAVVALDPRTGEVLALWSSPTYDPNELAALDGEQVRAAWERLNADPARPLENRALRRYYAPGSTFKLVTAAAALENGVTPGDTFADPVQLDLPQTTATIGNFGGGTCAGGQRITLAQALQVSCNTTFGQLGLQLGAAELVETAHAFGFGTDLGGQLPAVQPSQIPPADELDPPATAQSAIGQRDVRVTPLQMATIVATIAQGGVVPVPRIVRRIEDFGGGVQQAFEPAEFRRAVSAQTAAALRDMMVGVVEAGTGRAAQIPGVTVAGKTGTAEAGVEGGNPTVWFTAFAPAEAPSVAVAVVVEDGGDVGSEATGGAVAAPIARAVLETALAAQSG